MSIFGRLLFCGILASFMYPFNLMAEEAGSTDEAVSETNPEMDTTVDPDLILPPLVDQRLAVFPFHNQRKSEESDYLSDLFQSSLENKVFNHGGIDLVIFTNIEEDMVSILSQTDVLKNPKKLQEASKLAKLDSFIHGSYIVLGNTLQLTATCTTVAEGKILFTGKKSMSVENTDELLISMDQVAQEFALEIVPRIPQIYRIPEPEPEPEKVYEGIKEFDFVNYDGEITPSLIQNEIFKVVRTPAIDAGTSIDVLEQTPRVLPEWTYNILKYNQRYPNVLSFVGRSIGRLDVTEGQQFAEQDAHKKLKQAYDIRIDFAVLSVLQSLKATERFNDTALIRNGLKLIIKIAALNAEITETYIRRYKEIDAESRAHEIIDVHLLFQISRSAIHRFIADELDGQITIFNERNDDNSVEVAEKLRENTEKLTWVPMPDPTYVGVEDIELLARSQARLFGEEFPSDIEPEGPEMLKITVTELIKSSRIGFITGVSLAGTATAMLTLGILSLRVQGLTKLSRAGVFLIGGAIPMMALAFPLWISNLQLMKRAKARRDQADASLISRATFEIIPMIAPGHISLTLGFRF